MSADAEPNARASSPTDLNSAARDSQSGPSSSTINTSAGAASSSEPGDFEFNRPSWKRRTLLA